jgi:hypothetical protein
MAQIVLISWMLICAGNVCGTLLDWQLGQWPLMGEKHEHILNASLMIAWIHEYLF